MEITGLRERSNLTTDTRLFRFYNQFGHLLAELRGRLLAPDIISAINTEVKMLNATADNPLELRMAVGRHQTRILRLLRQNLKLVPRKYYQKRGVALGMSAFGIPAGVLFGLVVKNMAMLSVGLPVGLGVGLGVGSLMGARMDKKALQQGRQLQTEI